jgi:hypothetical protein
MNASPYRDPRAMRNAIADRLRPLARDRGVELSSLQRQFAYDRLLTGSSAPNPIDGCSRVPQRCSLG